MFFNYGMSIWILAVLVLIILALAGWRQGGIMASFSFVGILFGALLAVPVGKIFHPLLPHLGAANPLVAWAMAPLCGFVLISIIFTVVGIKVSKQTEVRFKHKESELRNAMYLRLNVRLGIIVGLLNGAAYFILVSFVIYNLAYLTKQVAVAPNQPFAIRTLTQMGNDLQSAGLERTAVAVGSLPHEYYQISDLAGFLMQNPDAAGRLANYPGMTSLWQRDDMQSLVTDPTLTNALAAGSSIQDILNEPSVQDFMKNKDLRNVMTDAIETNLDDLTTYLQTGKSAKYSDKIIGQWDYNVRVTLAWWRLSQSKVDANEMLALRNLWSKAYGDTTVLATGDHQLFIKNLPHFNTGTQPNQPPTIDQQNWRGDWSVDDGTNYTLHVSLNGEDKFLSATADDLRMSAKDGRTKMFFDREF
jgi:hypothetical protein